MRDGRPVAFPWKFFAKKNDIYALNRGMGSETKLSIHNSGRICLRQGPRNQIFSAPMTMRGDVWRHVVEIRFLLSADCGLPPTAAELDKAANTILREVPPGYVLYLNLFISTGSEAPRCPPSEVGGATELWCTQLADGRSVTLVARALRMDENNAAAVRFIREELKPQVTIFIGATRAATMI